jgi:hypothetical protein
MRFPLVRFFFQRYHRIDPFLPPALIVIARFFLSRSSMVVGVVDLTPVSGWAVGMDLALYWLALWLLVLDEGQKSVFLESCVQYSFRLEAHSVGEFNQIRRNTLRRLLSWRLIIWHGSILHCELLSLPYFRYGTATLSTNIARRTFPLAKTGVIAPPSAHPLRS